MASSAVSLAANQPEFEFEVGPHATGELMVRSFEAETELRAPYPIREYCVQYNESDRGFVEHLLEEAGIFCYLTHERDAHTLVLADAPSARRPEVLAQGDSRGDGRREGYRLARVTWL